MANARMSIRAARVEEIIDLRHAVLREGMPLEAAVFEGDDAPDTRHYGAFVRDRRGAVGCATLHLNEWEAEPAWQLRGMATAPEYRGRGVGRMLLEYMER